MTLTVSRGTATGLTVRGVTATFLTVSGKVGQAVTNLLLGTDGTGLLLESGDFLTY